MARPCTDMTGRQLILPDAPQRIVSLVPSQTELLHALGLDAEVAGITKFCIHPESWFRTKARVGGTKQVHADRVAALRPDLILANKEENVREQIESLQEIAPVWVSDIRTLPDALEMIRAVGNICNCAAPAEELAAGIGRDFAQLRPAESRSVAYAIWRGPWMWAGGDTFIGDLLGRIGWRNVLQDVPRYPALDLEALAAYRPQVILLSSEPYPFRERHIAEIRALLPEAQVRLVDGELFSWYGSRLTHSVSYFKTLISAINESC